MTPEHSKTESGETVFAQCDETGNSFVVEGVSVVHPLTSCPWCGGESCLEVEDD